VLRKRFGPKTDHVRGNWRTLHIEEHRGFCYLIKYKPGDRTKKNEVGGACGTHGGNRRKVVTATVKFPLPYTEGKYPEQLRNYELAKKGFVLWSYFCYCFLLHVSNLKKIIMDNF
jgi:hypothetical protein